MWGADVFIDAGALDPRETYRLLVGSVVPRPIAWVTSGITPGPVNLAPFSSFTWVSQYPAMLGFTVNRRESGVKDTLRNIERDGEYVVNIATASQLDQLHASSEGFPPDRSEADELGLRLVPSRLVRVPSLADAPISMECSYDRTIAFSATGGDFVVGTVVGWRIDDAVMRGRRIDTQLLDPIARLAGPTYARLGPMTTLDPLPGG
ncbi:flavin reductase family protein [Microbacterium sp. ARD31]|uniref:flavin reductase family protein n=1 Tax=Microbacterium sp. ARD31 TaxID=2962576 RepID=UPI002881D17D|nr:flavin reductase family protein [Microbacterium sp. ARD31]MDT0183986.1 flavin reductase family protein [Microbacterium sp. ARD31]